MGDIPPIDIPLFTAIRLVRLRDRLHGVAEPDMGLYRGSLILGRDLASKMSPFLGGLATKMEKGTLMRKDRIRTTMRQVETVEGILDYWEEAYTRQAETIEKFLSVLEGVHLPLQSERDEMKRIRQANENAVQRARKGLAIVKSALEGRDESKLKELESIKRERPPFNELFDVEKSLGKVREAIDKRTMDVITMVSLMTGNDQSKRLLELFTGEP